MLTTTRQNGDQQPLQIYEHNQAYKAGGDNLLQTETIHPFSSTSAYGSNYGITETKFLSTGAITWQLLWIWIELWRNSWRKQWNMDADLTKTKLCAAQKKSCIEETILALRLVYCLIRYCSIWLEHKLLQQPISTIFYIPAHWSFWYSSFC